MKVVLKEVSLMELVFMEVRKEGVLMEVVLMVGEVTLRDRLKIAALEWIAALECTF